VFDAALGGAPRQDQNDAMRKIPLPLLIVAALLPTALLLGACSGNRGTGATGGAPYGVEAHFMATDPTIVEVAVHDPLPAARVVLIDPTGVETAAFDIQRDKRIYRGGGGPSPSVGVGVGGGSHSGVSTGIGIGFPIFSSGQSGQTSAVVDSIAKVRISNPVLYRGTWQSWKLRIELDDGVSKRTLETLPPKPL
jgi:hypothetical protein